MVLAIFRYLRTVLSHKWFVFVAGRWFGVPIWRLLVHDLSKFSLAEFMPYVYKHELKQRGGIRYDCALLHHYNHNDHHLDYWILRGVPVEMPNVCVREMVADWFAASRAYDGARGRKKGTGRSSRTASSRKCACIPRQERKSNGCWPNTGKEEPCSTNLRQGDLL